MASEQAERIAQMIRTTREDTLQLFDMVREEHLHASPGFGFRPPVWHLAHIGVFESFWILQKLNGEPPLDERYERIFDPIKTPREQSANLPSRREMEDFLSRVRDRVFHHLERFNFDDTDPLRQEGYAFHLVLEHERQHQETLAYLLHLLDPKLKNRLPVTNDHRDAATDNRPSIAPSSSQTNEMILIPDGSFVMGSIWDSFAYDNELPAHEIHLPAFKIDRLPVTNEEYARFIEAGGYARPEWWSADGLAWRERENIYAPLYWMSRENSPRWIARRMFDEGAPLPHHPVSGVSWHEAEAYARFAGKRLPSEAEWEKAASWNRETKTKNRFAWGDDAPGDSEEKCNFDNRLWGTTPVGAYPSGASASGCLDMTGNVWEWTSDLFRGYPGFRAFPYPEYSEEWFDDDHRVLKGGSWATRASILRTSFRNFFRRSFRIAFAGIRCAS